MIKTSFIFDALLINAMLTTASETLKFIYLIGGTAAACVILVVILNMSRKISQLKEEIKKLQNK
jgi:bacteriorhodopsin